VKTRVRKAKADRSDTESLILQQMSLSEEEAPVENSVARTERSGVNEAMKNLKLPGTTIVRTVEDARRVVAILYKYGDRVHAWDTETINIDAKEETPVGHGYVISA
jgi:hypothetical protein